MSKKPPFLYQINFNRDKYPDICEALDEAKERNGIAWYLRKLISKDIEARKSGHVEVTAVNLPDLVPDTEEEIPEPEPKPIKQKPKPVEEPKKEIVEDLPDGGFM